MDIKEKLKEYGWMTKAAVTGIGVGGLTYGAVKLGGYLAETGIDNLTAAAVGVGAATAAISGYIMKNEEEERELLEDVLEKESLKDSLEAEAYKQKEETERLKKHGNLEQKLEIDKERFPKSYKITSETDLFGVSEMLYDLKTSKDVPHLSKEPVKESMVRGIARAYNESIEYDDGMDRFVVLEQKGIGKHANLFKDEEKEHSDYAVKIFTVTPNTKEVFRIDQIAGARITYDNKDRLREFNKRGDLADFDPGSESITEIDHCIGKLIRENEAAAKNQRNDKRRALLNIDGLSIPSMDEEQEDSSNVLI